MPEIWFYHLQIHPLEHVLPGLIQKSLERGWRVAVQARSEERLDALDEWLWTFAEESFLAHGRSGDGDAELQPIFLATGTENPNGAAVRFFIEGAEVLPALEDASYERAITLFDGGDEDELAAARRQWKDLKALGFPLTYWQQAETGRWEKKA
jgi:DNA polymerase-3 subunit chi